MLFIFPFPRIPSEDPSGQSVVLPRDQFYRILQASRVLTKEEREAQEAQLKEEKIARQVRLMNISSE